MAVGKGSMERASRAVAKTETTVKKAAQPRKTTAKSSAPKKSVVPAVDKAVLQEIVYQESKDMLYRDALPNERFEVGEPMPVYYY